MTSHYIELDKCTLPSLWLMLSSFRANKMSLHSLNLMYGTTFVAASTLNSICCEHFPHLLAGESCSDIVNTRNHGSTSMDCFQD